MGDIFAGPPFGRGVFTAGLILSIMVIPFIAAVMRDVFELVPPLLKESAYGLGSTTWEVVWKVVLPYTKSGVRSEEHTSELQSLMRISYAVFCLKNKKKTEDY